MPRSHPARQRAAFVAIGTLALTRALLPFHVKPLDWCLRPGVKLDFRHFEAGYVVTPLDIETIAALAFPARVIVFEPYASLLIFPGLQISNAALIFAGLPKPRVSRKLDRSRISKQDAALFRSHGMAICPSS